MHNEDKLKDSWKYNKKIRFYYPFPKFYKHIISLIREGFYIRGDFMENTILKTQDQKFSYKVEKYLPEKYLVISTVNKNDIYRTKYSFGPWGKDSVLYYEETIDFVWTEQKNWLQKLILKNSWKWKIWRKAVSIRKKVEKNVVKELDRQYRLEHPKFK